MGETGLEPERSRAYEITPSVSLRDLFIVLFKWQWTIVLVLFTVALVTLVWLMLLRSPAYEVSAKLLVKLGNEQASPPTVVGTQLTSVSYRAYDVNSEVEILASPLVLGEVVDYFGMALEEKPVEPEKLLPRLRYWLRTLKEGFNDSIDEALTGIGFRERLSPRELAIFTLSRGLRVTPKRESYVIIVSLFLPVRRGASDVLNKLIDVYLDRRRQVFKDEAAVEFFREQVESYASDLIAVERKMRKLEAEAGISDIEKQKGLLLDQLAQVRHELAMARIELLEASSKLERFKQEMARGKHDFAVVGDFEPGSFPESMLLQLADLMREKESLRAEESSKGRRSAKNRYQFELLTKLLASNLQAVKLEREATYKLLKQELTSLERELDGIKARESEWRTLNRDILALEHAYGLQREKLNEASVRAALLERQVGNVVLIQPATDPLLPVGMRKGTLFALIMIVSVFGLMAWIAVAEFFDHRFYTPESLEAELNVPIIGVIPAGYAADRSPRVADGA